MQSVTPSFQLDKYKLLPCSRGCQEFYSLGDRRSILEKCAIIVRGTQEWYLLQMREEKKIVSGWEVEVSLPRIRL